MSLQSIVGFIEEVSEEKEAILVLADKVMELGAVLYPHLNTFANAVTDIRANSIKRLVGKHGFTTEEAIRISISQTQDFKENLQKVNK